MASLPVAAPGAPAASGSFPVVRTLILNGFIVVAVVVAILLGSRDGGPTTIAFEPATWHCDGTERAWIATIPARAADLRLDWMTGGPAGEVRATMSTTRAALEAYLQADGSFRVTTTAIDAAAAPECALEPGTYTLAVRDAGSGSLVASGRVDLGP